MTPSHKEDLCNTQGGGFLRLRMHAWIVKGKHLAKMLVRMYQRCRMMLRVPIEQRIGMLPKEKFIVPCVPINHITMDLTRPF